MTKHDDVAATLERLYPPVIGGPGWEDVLDRLDRRDAVAVPAELEPMVARSTSVIRRSLLAPLAAVVATAVLVAGPALAFSPKVRELVGLSTDTRPPVFVARVTGVLLHEGDTRPGALVTIRFTVGEAGKPPGTGIPSGSTFVVLLTRRSGKFGAAHGGNGRYQATIRLGPGRGIGGIQVGAFMPGKGSRVINGGIWIPTVVDIGR
jgi:hypothetical protein